LALLASVVGDLTARSLGDRPIYEPIGGRPERT
jgi:hypothetical protein